MAHGGAGAPARVRHILLGQTEFREQAFIAARFIHGREVVALQVLDQREREGGAVVDFPLHGGELFPAPGLAPAPPPPAPPPLAAAPATADGAPDHPRARD